ncbi:MAG: Hsp20/alpha crystallin family protein [Acidobacteria bacterium]|nr:Hsp20/alpha crystallin family protein [Acidobacteriota bacterium]
MAKVAIVRRDAGSHRHMAGRRTAAPWVPPVDVFETDRHYIVNAELAGVDRRDVRVEIAGNDVTICGRRRSAPPCCDEHYSRVEGSHGWFHRSFSLPEALDRAPATALIEDGLLQVRIEKPSPRRK